MSDHQDCIAAAVVEGRVKVNIQWLLYCLVHNLEKLAHKSKTYGRKRPLPSLLQAYRRLPDSRRSLFGTFRAKISHFCSSSLLYVA
jgi:hypothetical protein